MFSDLLLTPPVCSCVFPGEGGDGGGGRSGGGDGERLHGRVLRAGT